ncbi:MAG: WYL domain-containing protein [Oscillospiraceae bacterium]|nr:WYL domain-containing protein [Oscillospiraceae bacterium]
MPYNVPETTTSRVLAVLKYLREKTSADSDIRQEDICRYLEEQFGWKVKRQTVATYLSDMSCEHFNIGITCKEQKGNIKKYRYKGILSDAQLSLIADIVCSSAFLDTKTAHQMLEGIKGYMSDSRKLDFPDVNSYIRPKMLNRNCLDNIKQIHSAIRNNRKIEFYYTNMGIDKKLYYYTKYSDTKALLHKVWVDEKTDTAKDSTTIIEQSELAFTPRPLIASPYKLIWDSSKCYLVAGIIRGDKFSIVNYRVDRMMDIRLCGGEIDEDEGVPEQYLRYIPTDNEFFDNSTRALDTERFLKSTFKMFTSDSGRTTNITFRAHENIAKSIVDRFGYDTVFVKDKDDDSHFTFRISLQTSKPFWGWLAPFKHDDLHIVSPKSAKDEYKKHLMDILDSYE